MPLATIASPVPLESFPYGPYTDAAVADLSLTAPVYVTGYGYSFASLADFNALVAQVTANNMILRDVRKISSST